MIVMALLNPVAFVLTVLGGALALYGAEEWLGYTPPDDAWWPVVAIVVFYLILNWVMPWWTRPVELWRYWRRR